MIPAPSGTGDICSFLSLKFVAVRDVLFHLFCLLTVNGMLKNQNLAFLVIGKDQT